MKRVYLPSLLFFCNLPYNQSTYSRHNSDNPVQMLSLSLRLQELLRCQASLLHFPSRRISSALRKNCFQGTRLWLVSSFLMECCSNQLGGAARAKRCSN